MRGKNLTKEEYDNIKTMLEHGMKYERIAAIVNRSLNSISRVKNTDDYEDFKRYKAISAQKLAEAKAKVELIEKEPEAVQAHLLDDNLLLRIADGIDYNNALMNGLVAKLDLICKALGV